MCFLQPFKNSRGTALIEFAIVGSIFFMIIFAILDLGRYFFTQHTLQYATREGVRLALVGGRIRQGDSLLSRKDSIVATVRQCAHTAVPPDQLSVNVFEVGPGYSDPEKWEETEDAGDPGSYMRVKTRFFFVFLTPVAVFFDHGGVLMQAQATYRNELVDE
jgi:hypothetical protein